MEDRLSPRDWGKGIPKYSENDLMTKEELHDFGVEVVAGYLKQNGYKIHEYHPMYGMYPSIVAENKKEVIAVIVQSDVAPNVPEIKLTDKFGIIGYCNGFKTKPCYASVSFGSIDPERFDKSIESTSLKRTFKYSGTNIIHIIIKVTILVCIFCFFLSVGSLNRIAPSLSLFVGSGLVSGSNFPIYFIFISCLLVYPVSLLSINTSYHTYNYLFY